VIAATFGYSLGVGALPIQRVQLKSERRASYGTGKRPKQIEVHKEVHITPRMYQKLTQKIAGKPEERILSFLMLRSLKQARYSEENLGHFALAATHYAHFTSPIRRYPDLIVHRILRAVVQEQPERRDGEVPVGVFPINGASMNKDISADFGKNASPEGATDYSPGRKPWVADHPDHAQAERRSSSQPTPWSKRRNTPGAESHAQLVEPIPLDELHDIADESSRAERRAAEAERELMEWKKAKFMEQHIGDDFDGLIISVTKFGFFVELTDLFVEGLVPLTTLADDHYTYHENTREIIGQRNHKIYSMGQRVRVIVDRIDPVEKKIQFALLAPPSRPSEKRSQPKKTKKIKKAKKSR
jgi:ribonuclease R